MKANARDAIIHANDMNTTEELCTTCSILLAVGCLVCTAPTTYIRSSVLVHGVTDQAEYIRSR